MLEKRKAISEVDKLRCDSTLRPRWRATRLGRDMMYTAEQLQVIGKNNTVADERPSDSA
jgi:hypothetical protein